MAEPTLLGQFFTYTVIALLVAALVLVVGYSLWTSSRTTPVMADGFKIQQHPRKSEEGFAGPAVGAGMPDCMHTSKDCAALYDMFARHKVGTEEGPDDLRELKLILSKIACLRRDLLGNAKVVQATRYQPFSTAHDLEPVAETAARCFSKTIPQRDLTLSLDKWGSRGTFLIKRICSAMNLSDSDDKEALRLFGDAMADIISVTTSECCSAGVFIGGEPGPRSVLGFTPPSTLGLRDYKGYY